jgi:hypothetical protein
LPLFLLEGHRNIGVGRQAHLVALHLSYQTARDEVMMTLMAAEILGLGQLDSIAVDPVDRADVDPIGSDHFHMFLDILKSAHRRPPSLPSPNERNPFRMRQGRASRSLL